MELAFYFEASGYCLPGIPGAKYMAISLSFQERARVLRPALVNTQRHAAVGSLFPGQFVARANSQAPVGAGRRMGLSARPYFSSPGSMIGQLEALQKYCDERWIRRNTPRTPTSLLGYHGCPPLMVNPDNATPRLETSCMRASARGGSRPGFAADYFPKHAHAPFAIRHPVKMRAPDQGMPSQTRPVRLPPSSHCENHREPACKRHLRLCRGVRACCRHGHHRCRKHSLPPCALCAGSSVLPRICCKG